MRRVFRIFLCCFFPLSCYAQEISHIIQLQDGSLVDYSHIFQDGETVTFRLENNENYANIKWTLELPDKEDGKYQVVVSEEEHEQFSFEVSPDKLPFYEYNYKTTVIENDSSVYIKCFVCLYKNETLIDRLPVTFNVLPSRPTVKSAYIDGTFDFNDMGYIPLAKLDVTFKSARMNRCSLIKFDSDSLNVFQFPCNNVNIIYEYTANRINSIDDIHNITFDYADWGEFYMIIASNKYGGCSGDTIFTTECITDLKVKEAIQRFHEAVINDIEFDTPKIIISNNAILLDDAIADVTTSIFSSDGKLIYTYNSQKRIDITQLPKGVYLIKFNVNGKKAITNKIIKK